MTYRFAAETNVPPERTRAEIEGLLRQVGCDRFGLAVTPAATQLAFWLAERGYRFTVRTPSMVDREVQFLPSGRPRPDGTRKAVRDQIERTRWRSLLLVIKAQLAAVEVELLPFEQAFLGQLVLPSGRTVAEETAEPIQLAYLGRAVPLLQGPAA